jgi:hypothetical protein
MYVGMKAVTQVWKGARRHGGLGRREVKELAHFMTRVFITGGSSDYEKIRSSSELL